MKTITTLEELKKNLKELAKMVSALVCAAIFMFALYLLTLIF